MKNISVIGAGTWGIALARLLKNDNNDVTVYSVIKEEIDELKRTNVHKNLPKMVLPEGINYTCDIDEAIIGKEIIVVVVPSIFLRSTCLSMKKSFNKNQIIVCATKGIEENTLFTMSDVIKDCLGSDTKVVCLSGPTHAEEVSLDMLTTIVSASSDLKLAEYIQSVFSTKYLRVYTNTDIIGVELCGAVKNVIAIACGISSGLGYGDNAKAALITRGIHEIGKLGCSMGCNIATFSGLAGLGDLIVTATSVHSRNNKFGYLIGKGYSIEDAKKEVGMVVEGLNGLKAVYELSIKYNVNMPIVSSVYNVIYLNQDINETVYNLFNRESKSEFVIK